MPVIRATPSDPTDLVTQGEQLRAVALGLGVMFAPMGAASFMPPLSPSLVVAREQNYGVTFLGDGSAAPPTREVLRSQEAGNLVAANALISTPCGALIQIPRGQYLFCGGFTQATDTFAIVGVTKTGAGAALGNCRVVVQETGRIAVDGHAQSPSVARGLIGSAVEPNWASQSPVVAETISDGSGNFSVPVPLNTAYQLDGYKAGSPDVAGITRNDVKPTDASTTIFLRDPTAQDTPGGSGLSARVIGSAVVRRISL